MERGEQPAVDRLGQAEFGRDMAVEVAKEVLAVGPFGRRGQPEQDLRGVVREEVAVRGGGRVVHLVDDDVVEVVRRGQGREVLAIERLDRHEDVVAPARQLAPAAELAEVVIPEDPLEAGEALLEDLLAMGDVEEAGVRVPGEVLAEVEGRDHGLPGPGRRDDEVPIPSVDLAFRLQPIEHVLLIVEGADVEVGAGLARGAPLRAKGIPEAIGVRWGIQREIGGRPVGLEGHPDLVDEVAFVPLAQLDIPLQAGGDGRVGEVRGADVDGREATLPMEGIGLRMEAGALGVVGDPDLSVGQGCEELDGLGVRRAHIRGGDDPERTRRGEGPQLVHEQADAAPLDERDEEIDTVRREDLGLELVHEAWLGRRPREEGVLREKRGRAAAKRWR